MVDEDLGRATLVYEGPDGEPIERTVENEHVAYFQDHWVFKADDGDHEHDTIRRVPSRRVYYVERDVEEFEEEVSTLIDEVQSVASDVEREFQTLRSRVESVADEVQTGLLGGALPGEQPEDAESEVLHIDVESEAERDDEYESGGDDGFESTDDDEYGSGDDDEYGSGDDDEYGSGDDDEHDDAGEEASRPP